MCTRAGNELKSAAHYASAQLFGDEKCDRDKAGDDSDEPLWIKVVADIDAR
jgi:hypothetical protein